MTNYFIAFNKPTHDTSIKSWASCMGYYTFLEGAKIRAKELTDIGYKNVTVFAHDGYDPYDKVMTHCVSWDYVMKHKVE
jgi:hypothetical protein